MSNTIADNRPTWDELSDRLTEGRKGSLGDATDCASDMTMMLLDALYTGDEYTMRPAAEVVEVIDEALGILHTIREAAVTENRRRQDAAMERSAKLLGGDAR